MAAKYMLLFPVAHQSGRRQRPVHVKQNENVACVGHGPAHGRTWFVLEKVETAKGAKEGTSQGCRAGVK